MAASILIIIRGNPLKTSKPVEGLRIALGLSTGENPLTIVLVGGATQLLSEDDEEILDSDILEKYLPSLKQLQISFVVPQGTRSLHDMNSTFNLREASEVEIAALVASADRVLTF